MNTVDSCTIDRVKTRVNELNIIVDRGTGRDKYLGNSYIINGAIYATHGRPVEKKRKKIKTQSPVLRKSVRKKIFTELPRSNYSTAILRAPRIPIHIHMGTGIVHFPYTLSVCVHTVRAYVCL